MTYHSMMRKITADGALSPPPFVPERGVRLKEVCMAAPNVIHLIFHDEDFERYAPVPLASPDPGAALEQVQRLNPTTGQIEWAWVVGKDKMYNKFTTRLPQAFLDKAAVTNIANYPAIGGRTVTHAGLCSMPEDNDTLIIGGAEVSMSVWAHHVYLVLSANLPAGSYTITNSAGAFSPVAFEFAEDFVRCSAIHASHIGHRPGDKEKVAYLSLWVPGYGAEGAIDFATAHGVTQFHVIDSMRQVRFTGTVQLRTTPDTVEAPQANFPYPTSIPSKIKTATAVTVGNPTLLRINGHGYTTGEKKYFTGFSSGNGAGINGLEALYADITVIDADWISVPLASTGTYLSTMFTPETICKVHDTHLSNRAKTYVYECNYSAFEPADGYGEYQVYIPGLGCSWPFAINDGVYYAPLRKAMVGYLWQCWGIAKPANLIGFDIPASFHDGVNGCEIFKSLMPSMLHVENIPFPDTYQFTTADDPPWATTDRVTDWFGGWSDAGDWDMAMASHATALISLLDMGYTMLPSAVRDIMLGFPKASQSFAYLADYSAIDDLGDVVHMVIHYLEPYRRFQETDGRVFSGMQFSGVGTTGGGGLKDMSWITAHRTYLLAADHTSNFYYAAAAAALAKVLKAAGKTTLAALWQQSALDAYNWAEAIRADYAANGIAGTVWGAYYQTVLGVQAKTGWDNATMTAAFNNCENLITVPKLIAAVCFQEYTNGAEPWNTTVEAAAATGFSNNVIAGHLYLSSPVGAPANKTYNITHAADDATNVYANYDVLTSSCYRGKAASNYYSPLSGKMTSLLRALRYHPTLGMQPDSLYMRALLAMAGDAFGANQQNLCTMTGEGRENPGVLHRDREWLGIPSSRQVGLIPFTYSYRNDEALGVFNYGLDTPSNYTATRLWGTWESYKGSTKLYTPNWAAVPAHQNHKKNTYIIFQAELITVGAVIQSICLLLWLHTFGTNTVTQTVWPKRFLAKAA